MGYRLRWPKKNLTHCPGWVDHYNPFSPSTQISEQELNAEYVRVLQQAHLPIPKL